MATLQSIRNHGTILLVVVGLAMLAFILGDFLNGSSSFFNKNRENVAEIAGHNVHYTEYEAAKEQLTDVYKFEYGTSDINEDLTLQIRNQVWQTMLMDYTLREHLNPLLTELTNFLPKNKKRFVYLKKKLYLCAIFVFLIVRNAKTYRNKINKIILWQHYNQLEIMALSCWW